MLLLGVPADANFCRGGKQLPAMESFMTPVYAILECLNRSARKICAVWCAFLSVSDPNSTYF